MENKYIVPEKRLRELLKAEARLAALEAGGVDNWEWYSDSLNDYLKNFCERNNITRIGYTYEQLTEDGLEEFPISYPRNCDDDENYNW